MKTLVLNCGSSSIKYQLRDAGANAPIAEGLVSRIGEDPAIPDHGRALELILDTLLDPETGAIKDLSEVSAVGHRAVHGGSFFTAPVLITPEVIAKMEEHAPLAPLHNPPILLGIREALRVLPGIPQVAVFDTAFHTTVPARAHVYALPYRYYTDHGVRRYGFHGNSFQYVSQRVDVLLGGRLRDIKVVIAHLGNGASIAAVDGGRSVDTSMGLTPLEGLVMGTRPGDVDPGVILYMMRQLGLDESDVDHILNKESGLLGVSGVGNDIRDVLAAAAAGDERSELAIELYAYRLKKYVGAYAAAMGGLDVLVFTAGIGENSPEIRAAVCEGLGFLGIELDEIANRGARGVESDIATVGARVRVLVIPTDEERLIADETVAVVSRPAATRR
ncbi:MAG: acetate kinase [Thermoleophilia bacterium]|nr:acetate kinase [Thermoleophilia bacterium]